MPTKILAGQICFLIACDHMFRYGNYIFAFLLFSALLVRGAEETIILPQGGKITVFIEYPELKKDAAAPLAVVIGGGPGERKQAESAMKKLGLPLVERGKIVPGIPLICLKTPDMVSSWIGRK